MDSAHRSGYVVIAGRPNVGKSTMLNALLQESLLPVSPKPQTTRKSQLAILTSEAAQVIFVDTPGLHAPHHRLGELMNRSVARSLQDADVLVAMFDLHMRPGPEDERVAQEAADSALILLNKIDITPPEVLRTHWEMYEALLPRAKSIGISALKGDNLDVFLEELIARLPEGPRYFPEDELTDTVERDIAADLIRAAALDLLREEVPHSIAVSTDEYKERNGAGAYIAATIYVERDSQKGIVIGRGGRMLREIGTQARKRIESLTGRKTYLELRVKVLPGWRNDEGSLRRLGYSSGR